MRRSWLLPGLIAVFLVALAGPIEGASPNSSILLWKPGKAVTGTLKNRIYTRVGSFVLTGVSLAAASRSSLALYTRSTGRLRTGTFRNGVYSPVESITVRSGFTHAAASCDSLILYNRATGRYLAGTLTGGRFRNRSTGFLAAGAERVSATCRDVLLWDVDGERMSGFPLSGGDVGTGSDAGIAPSDPGARFATTDDSYVFLLDQLTPFGSWGTVDSQGDDPIVALHSSSDFEPWRIVAGTADSLLFYNPDGHACRWWIKAGEIQVSSCAVSFPAGFTIIAGGK